MLHQYTLCSIGELSETITFEFRNETAIIVLHLEEQAWPPEGIFESIYIPFSKSKPTNEWPENQFVELLGHTRRYIAPDPDLISELYCHLFVPCLDTLIFFKSNIGQNNDKSLSFHNIPLVMSHPQIIISYQQLTQLGYRLWLDLFQMRGGDSLLEKYNIALRQTLCLLVCITLKYIEFMYYQHDFSSAKDCTECLY